MPCSFCSNRDVPLTACSLDDAPLTLCDACISVLWTKCSCGTSVRDKGRRCTDCKTIYCSSCMGAEDELCTTCKAVCSRCGGSAGIVEVCEKHGRFCSGCYPCPRCHICIVDSNTGNSGERQRQKCYCRDTPRVPILGGQWEIS